MTLSDRTNETIPLSQHKPLTWEANETHGWEAGEHAPVLHVDADSDSSFDPSHWVHMGLTDEEHDSDRIKMTYEEAGLLHDRLGLILGRNKPLRSTGLGSRFAAGPYAPVGVIHAGSYSGPLEQVLGALALHALNNQSRGMAA